MPTEDDLSSLPPATLRAALDASEKRIRREKEQIQREIRRLQKRLEELDEGADAQEVGLEINAAGGSQRKVKRIRIDSPSDDDEVVEEKYSRWPIAKARRVDSGPVPPKSPSCTRCRKRGVRCEWDDNPRANARSCLACQHSKLGCDLKRPIRGGQDKLF